MLQSQLEQGNADFITKIFDKLKPFFVVLIIDSFGNYFIQKLS